jgi:hypothetical protein
MRFPELRVQIASGVGRSYGCEALVISALNDETVVSANGATDERIRLIEQLVDSGLPFREFAPKEKWGQK